MEHNVIDITGLDKAEVLAALYNASRPQGMGFLQATPGDMSVGEAQSIISEGREYEHDYGITSANALYHRVTFDYLKGRVLKVDISGDTFDARLYDRDLGAGATARAIAPLATKIGQVAS